MGLINTVTGPAHLVTNTWDPTRDVLTRKQNRVGATIISAYDYSVNALGQRTNVGNSGSAFASARSIAWGYDSLGQVTKADSSVSGFDRAYQYDGIGNRKKAANSLALPTADNYTANALNQYTAVGTIIPTYDDDGNATAYPVPTRLTANSTLAWDAENRMNSANVNSVTTTYLYDAGSRRIAQTTGTTTTVFVYDGWNPVAEYTGSTLKKTYTWGSDLSGSLQGAGGVGGLLAVTDQVAAGKPSYFPTFDGNGNVSEYLTSAGASVAHYEYDPFGRSTTSTGTLATSFAHRFSTKPVDGPTGLYYYGYRYLDPVTGRWPSRDPIEENGGLKLYGFIGNRILEDIDVLGAWSLRERLEKGIIGMRKEVEGAFTSGLSIIKDEVQSKLRKLVDEGKVRGSFSRQNRWIKKFGRVIEVNGNVAYRIAVNANGDISASLSVGAGGRAKGPATPYTLWSYPMFDSSVRLSGGVRWSCSNQEYVDWKLEFGVSAAVGFRWDWENWFSGDTYFAEAMFGGSWKFDLIGWRVSQPWEWGGYARAVIDKKIGASFVDRTELFRIDVGTIIDTQ